LKDNILNIKKEVMIPMGLTWLKKLANWSNVTDQVDKKSMVP